MDPAVVQEAQRTSGFSVAITGDHSVSNDFNTQYPPWRMDRYAKKADRQRYVDAPKHRPIACSSPAEAERWKDAKAKYAAFIALWRRLPRPLVNAVGPMIVRNLG